MDISEVFVKLQRFEDSCDIVIARSKRDEFRHVTLGSRQTPECREPGHRLIIDSYGK